MIWDKLKKLKSDMQHVLDTGVNVHRTCEKGMKRFERPEWTNLTWSGPGFRRAHMDVVDATITKGLWMMHVCVMPDIGSDAPIYGFDVIAGEKKVTGAFLDYSPTTNYDHPMMKTFHTAVIGQGWSKERELPGWAKAIFSNDMIAAGNIQDEAELNKVCEIAKIMLYYYIETVFLYRGRGDDEWSIRAQNNYAHFQRQNPHTPRVMKSLGLPEDDVDTFIGDCLFPDIIR